MTSAARKLLSDALALPANERAALAEALDESLAAEAGPLSPEWQQAIGSRIAELEAGDVEPVAWADVEARIKKTLGR